MAGGITNQKIWDRLGTMQTDLALTAQTTQRIGKIIEGNGVPGLVKQVSILEEKERARAKREADESQVKSDTKKDKREIQVKLWFIVLTPIVSGLISLAIGLLIK